MKDKVQDFLGVVFFSWWGEENVILAWIKSIPFLILAIFILPFVWLWDKIKK